MRLDGSTPADAETTADYFLEVQFAVGHATVVSCVASSVEPSVAAAGP